MFGLTGETLANRVRDAARAGGLGDGFSGHSGTDRHGPTDGGRQGRRTLRSSTRGRWRHGDMVSRYTRGELAGEALKWLS